MSVFYDNFLSLCAEKDVKPSFVARAIGLSNATATAWKKGKLPTPLNLEKLASYFDVSTEYLLTEQEKPTIPEDDGLTATQAAAMEFIKTLSDEQLKRFIAMGKAAFEDRG